MPKQTILVIEDEEKLRRVIGLHLAAAGYDFVVRLWDVTTGEPIQELRGHTWLIKACKQDKACK